MAKKPTPKTVETLRHDADKRKNIPTAEYQSVVEHDQQHPMRVAYERRNRDLDPQLVWRGKDEKDWSELVVHAPPLYIQEKVHPKVLIDDLLKQTRREHQRGKPDQLGLFADFNGMPEGVDKTDFYQHDQNWSNRFILGDSLQVMASLAEREGLRGQVQCIYFDPPYGIKFNSNWQVSTRSRDVKDGKIEEISREPEQVRAFRDTWKDGIHSYLTYLRDRLTAMRDLLTESGSIFVQISDENVHRVRGLLDEIFGPENFISEVVLKTTSGAGSPTGGTVTLANVHDFVLWYGRDKERVKYRQLYFDKADMQTAGLYNRVVGVDGKERRATDDELSGAQDLPDGEYLFRPDNLTSQSSPESATFKVAINGMMIGPGKGGWKTNPSGMNRLRAAARLYITNAGSLQYQRRLTDFNVAPINDIWSDVGTGSFTAEKVYVVQTNTKVIQRCILMATDPGDLVLDPTCGSGTTATVAEQWGRRWITIDTSRVALALARARVMGAKYPYYLLADSKEGWLREGELTGKPPVDGQPHGDIRQGFVYDRAPHVTLKSIANNAEIDVIWDESQAKLEPLRRELNAALGKKWEEWEIPREAADSWSANVKGIHAVWWEQRIARQKKIDESIAKKADVELRYDRPYEDKSRIRVAGPFTVESLSPHRVVPSSESELIDELDAAEGKRKRKLPKGTDELNDFTTMILEHLETSGVQQAKKADRITFTSITGWPGTWIAAEGRFMEGESEKRAAIFIGPEFGTVSRADLTAAAREALDARFDALIACGFNFEAHTSELNKLGPLPILKAKMNPELHMSDELKNTGAGNLFVVFGEPDIKWEFNADGEIVVEVLGVDVFDPKTGEVRASGKDDIAAWFIDTDYNEESFFVRHAYFMGANDPYKSLKTALKAEIDEDAWATLYRDKSRPFPRPDTGRFAVKVINHFGDEVMKVFAV